MSDSGVNRNEADERAYLVQVRGEIRAELTRVSDQVNAQSADLIGLKRYLEDNKAGMDSVEQGSVRQSIDQMAMMGEHGAARQHRLSRLLSSPYFGRIDIRARHDREAQAVYIGLHSFSNTEAQLPRIHDWRAPLSSLFYDFEIGEAFYDTPGGRTECRLVRKRQYRIEKGALVFMLETSLNIHDEVLQRVLSRASDDKMRNIVATIQRDQNAIIRNERAQALIIQGAAGSGKTSIALHRIAFLLYKLKDTIRSNEILIVSPNKVFANYISQVLPELGEEMIEETTMENLASQLLAHRVPFQSFSEQVSRLLTSQDRAYSERIKFKATSGFLRQLAEYALHVQNTNVRATHLRVGRHPLPAAWIAERFRRCATLPFAQQINEVLGAIVDRMQTRHAKAITGPDRTRLRGQLKRMLASTSLKALYKGFYVWLGKPEMFKAGSGASYEYADVFPLIHLKLSLEGVTPYDRVKHLVIDEMQDYTPVQYGVIARLFPCKKTVLGDYNQCVNPLSSTTAEAIREILPGAECMYMNRSFRSTLEITEFAQRIQRNPDLVPIERHGDRPEIIACRDAEEELDRIRRTVRTFLQSGRHSLGILCKTQGQADSLYESIKPTSGKIHLLNAQSTVFGRGAIIATAHLVKGLEFDQVLLPFCSAANYRTLIDRHMLYVGCTRAMHQLSLTHTGELSPFLQPEPPQAMI
ncbi:MAG: HelD family protein [Limisphaerales bacterium]